MFYQANWQKHYLSCLRKSNAYAFCSVWNSMERHNTDLWGMEILIVHCGEKKSTSIGGHSSFNRTTSQSWYLCLNSFSTIDETDWWLDELDLSLVSVHWGRDISLLGNFRLGPVLSILKKTSSHFSQICQTLLETHQNKKASAAEKKGKKAQRRKISIRKKQFSRNKLKRA